MARILIVDDSTTFRLLASALLAQSGHEVLEAPDGATAVQVASADAPDCVLLDYNLPDGNGLDFLRTMRDRGLKMPVVVLSAGVTDETRDTCQQAGAVAAVDKPKTLERFDEVIRDALSR